MESAPSTIEFNADAEKPERKKGKRADGAERDRLGRRLMRGEAEAKADNESIAVHTEERQIGQIVMTAAESRAATKAKYGEKRAGDEASTDALKHYAETMPHQELLELSSKIVVESTSLRQVYESHQIGEQALRRVVIEHLRGGDIRRILRDELLQHEIDFERDPQLRDQARQAAGDGSKTLNAMLQRADAAIGNQDSNEVAVLKARAVYQLKEQAKQAQKQHLINVSLVGTIVVLFAIVIVLMFTR